MFNFPPFIRKLLIVLLYVGLEAVALILLAHNSYYQQTKIMQGVRRTQYYVWEQSASWRSFLNLRQTNRDLAEENTRLRSELQKYYSKEVLWKESLISLPYPKDSFDFIPAQVVHNTVTQQQNYLIIDKGSEDGLTQDMGVICDKGIVGIINSVSAHHSMVISLLNTEQVFTAVHKRSETFGTLRWNGVDYNKVLMTEVPQHISVAVGDTICSSNFSYVFPPDLPIGTVINSSVKKGTFLELEIRLFADFKSLHYVNAIQHTGIQDIKELK